MSISMKMSLLLLAAGSLIVTGGCREREPRQPPVPRAQETAETRAEEPLQATVRLEPTENSQVRGTATFTQIPEGVRISAEVQGLEGPGKFGFHVHEFGDCSAPDASSAGGHFNPAGTPHGGPDDPPDQRHAGDLGNIEAGADGMARYERVDQVIQLDGPDSIIGRSLVVHVHEDDLETDPTGESGPRLACGVIEAISH
jgi:superoxide dismutase, Cu-Zn family